MVGGETLPVIQRGTRLLLLKELEPKVDWGIGLTAELTGSILKAYLKHLEMLIAY
jgi:hypothetical protein